MSTVARMYPDGRRGSNPIDIPRKKKADRDTEDEADRSESLDEATSSNEVSRRLLPNALDLQLMFLGVVLQLARTPPNASGNVGPNAHSRKTSPLSRPLPPLLPLSDPGPRLLPSTLALHRANHLLQSKNLASEPMPHPLPASLHPPPPVDVSDFDIDFILAGAAVPTTPGIPPYGSTSTDSQNPPAKSTLKLGPGGDDEDTFAKFVGAFDEEYDDRRDEWTFKVCSPASRVDLSPATDGNFEWEAQRAGRYVISPSGDVTSKHTGRTWRAIRRPGREFEIENLPIVPEEGPEPAFGHCPGSAIVFVLAPKTIHNELGGVKMARKRPNAPTIRTTSSGSDETPGVANPKQQATLAALSDRYGSDESARSSPMPNRGRNDRPGAFLSSRRSSKSQEPAPATGLSQMTQNLLSGNHADGSKREKKDKVSIGDKIKRTWKSGFNVGSPSFMDDRKERKEEKKQRQREKQQSHSWSGSSSQSSAWTSVGQSSGSSGQISSLSRDHMVGTSTEPRYQPPWISGSSKGSNDRGVRPKDSSIEGTATPPIAFTDETTSPMSFKEGKAWEAVPDDAMAMVIPLCKASTDSEGVETYSCTPALRNNSFFDNASPESLLVYFVPFTSNHLTGDRTSEAARRASMGQRLRRARSREQMNGGRPGATDFATDGPATQLVPLPFRSFRIVARVVSPDDLRSEPMLAPWPTPQAGGPDISQPAEEDVLAADSSGTRFPTVIAVCHSRGQGVEFVLEGLDRLGLCEGRSAWGPTGYEEWRGSGLSRTGREILDVLWTACVAILGLTSKPT